MKTIIQILLALLLINACVRGAESAWRYFAFKDAIGQELLFSASETTGKIQQRIVEIATEQGIELDPANVDVQRQRDETRVTFRYTENIPLVPRAYTRAHQYADSVSVRSLRAP